jgi:hypothetical protein
MPPLRQFSVVSCQGSEPQFPTPGAATTILTQHTTIVT